MKRFIKSRATGLYLREGGDWTDDWEQAMNFPNTQAVIAATQRFCLKNVDLVLTLGERISPRYDVIMPLSDPPPQPPSLRPPDQRRA